MDLRSMGEHDRDRLARIRRMVVHGCGSDLVVGVLPNLLHFSKRLKHLCFLGASSSDDHFFGYTECALGAPHFIFHSVANPAWSDRHVVPVPT